jgi:hypothetical protein
MNSYPKWTFEYYIGQIFWVDYANNRQHVIFTVGATAAAALTEIASVLKVDSSIARS